MEEPLKLTIKQKLFVEQYIYDWNATRAYNEVYKPKNLAVAASAGERLLRNVEIKRYIEEVQKDLSRLSGISKLKVLKELDRLAFSSIAHLHNSWIERKDFEKLTDDQKACVAEISTKIKRTLVNEESVETEFVKIKLHDKARAIETINKMLGFNEAEKLDLNFDKDKERVSKLFPTEEEFNQSQQ